MNEKEKLRLDKWLWAIRIYKTRAEASEACEKGKVKMDGLPVKAARHIKLEDVYEIKTSSRKWVIKVKGLLPKRVQYQEAILHYEDLTPPEEKQRLDYQAASFHTGKRQSKIGRPTKKERRDLDEFTG
jgi:ribosome-associated heat shock protein Hsp15